MRLSMIRALAILTVAAMALTACANQSGMMPSSPSAATPTIQQAPSTTGNDTGANNATTPNTTSQDSASSDTTDMSPLALKTCATSPPQYQWIFKGACQRFHVSSVGAHFSLGEYQGLTVKGSIGRNTAKGTVKFALADAIDKNGDIEPYNGKPFPRYKADPKYYEHSITYVYAVAVNESSQVIKPVTVKGKPVVRTVISNAKGFSDATYCELHVLTFETGKPVWDPLPGPGKIRGKTVTISHYVAPDGFELPPKAPVYFAVSCYKS